MCACVCVCVCVCVCIYICLYPESLCCTPETGTTLKINYTSINKKRKTESSLQSEAFIGQRYSLFSAACHSQLQEILPCTLSALCVCGFAGISWHKASMMPSSFDSWGLAESLRVDLECPCMWAGDYKAILARAQRKVSQLTLGTQSFGYPICNVTQNRHRNQGNGAQR